MLVLSSSPRTPALAVFALVAFSVVMPTAPKLDDDVPFTPWPDFEMPETPNPEEDVPPMPGPLAEFVPKTHAATVLHVVVAAETDDGRSDSASGNPTSTAP